MYTTYSNKMLQQKNQYTNVTGAQSGTINSRDGQVSRKEAGEESTATRNQKPTNHRAVLPTLFQHIENVTQTGHEGHWRRLGAQ